MARRRRREPDIIGGIGAIIGLVFILAMFASLGGQNLFGGILQGFFALVWLALLLVVVVGVLVLGFFVIRFLIMRRHRPAYYPVPTYAHPEPSTFSEPSLPAQQDFVSQLRATDWYQFEKVVGLIYESQGYTLHRRGGANPDGGIDLIIEKDGDRIAVQCKRWKKWKVDVPKVRELFGAMTHEGLQHGLIVALNGFTLEAKQLAVEHNIDIVHDEILAVMIAGLATADQLKVQAMLDDTTKHCPKCEATMVWRRPKPGKNWTPFWGCSRYPQCHGRLQGD
jgi:restriction system protein